MATLAEVTVGMLLTPDGESQHGVTGMQVDRGQEDEAGSKSRPIKIPGSWR